MRSFFFLSLLSFYGGTGGDECGGDGGVYARGIEIEYEDGILTTFQLSPLRAESRARRTSALPPASAVSS